jgi:putative flippase GtrA
MPDPSKEPTSMAKRFLTFCVAILTGVVLLYLALSLLARIWMWIVLIAVILLTGYVVFRVVKARQDRW